MVLCPPKSETLKSGNLGVEEVVSHTNTPSNPPDDLVLYFYATLGPVGFRSPGFHRGDTATDKVTEVISNIKLQL